MLTQDQIDTREELRFSSFPDQITHLIAIAYGEFVRVIKSHVRFHLLMGLIIFLELILIFIFSTTLLKSAFFALAVGGLLFTFFFYLLLRQYLLSKRPFQLLSVRERFIEECLKAIPQNKGKAHRQILIANACCKLAAAFTGIEYRFYAPPAWLKSLNSMMETFSCWFHWVDVHEIKELLLLQSIEEHVNLVIQEPTSLECHAALANAYVMLSGLYVEHKGQGGDRWIPSYVNQEHLNLKFRQTAERAIEEFKILNEYAPDDLWVHAQLAYSYRDLKMPEEEIREYEIMLAIRPEDPETLYKLGWLYFQHGHNAKGLEVYEVLREFDLHKANDLIQHYDSFRGILGA